MKLHAHCTIGELYEPAMAITEQAAADVYFAELVDRQARLFGQLPERAEQIERENLGYFAGYYDDETRARVERLFRCRHPIFGSIAEKGPPTAEQALLAGMMAGVEAKRKHNRREPQLKPSTAQVVKQLGRDKPPGRPQE